MKHKKLCPVCGQKAIKTGNTKEGRIILSCGDAVWTRIDRMNRVYWILHSGKKA